MEIGQERLDTGEMFRIYWIDCLYISLSKGKALRTRVCAVQPYPQLYYSSSKPRCFSCMKTYNLEKRHKHWESFKLIPSWRCFEEIVLPSWLQSEASKS